MGYGAIIDVCSAFKVIVCMRVRAEIGLALRAGVSTGTSIN